MVRPRVALASCILAATIACGERRDSSRSASREAAPGAVRPTSVAESTATARDEWSVSEVVRRLQEAGLVVSDSGEPARRAGIGAGHLLHVSGGALELYLYPTVAARRSASAAIDTVAHRLPSVESPRFIFSGNLIAVLTTPRDVVAERVENVLTSRHNGSGR